MNGNVTIALVLFTTINILALLFAPLLAVPTIGDFIVYQVISREEIETGRITGIDPTFDEGFDKDSTAETSVGGLFALIDGLKKIFAVLITILGLGFAVAGMLFAMNAPLPIVLLIGAPIGVGFYMGIIGAVRGKDL